MELKNHYLVSFRKAAIKTKEKTTIERKGTYGIRYLVGVRIQRHIGADHHLRELTLDHLQGPRHQAVDVVGLLSIVGLQVVGDLGKQNEGLDAVAGGIVWIKGKRGQSE